MSITRAALPASKSFSPAKSVHPENGKKPACPGQGFSTQTHRGTSHLLRKMQRLMRDPAYVAELRGEAALMAQHPEDEEINQWIEDMTDYNEWGPYDDF